METIKQIKKKLTVTQICVLGASSIFFILIILLFIFCLYANRQSRLETEEGGRMARGHWRDGEADIEVRRVSEPYARLATTGPAGPATRGDKQRMDRGPGGGAGPGVRRPALAHHAATQRGVAGMGAGAGVQRPADKSGQKAQAVSRVKGQPQTRTPARGSGPKRSGR